MSFDKQELINMGQQHIAKLIDENELLKKQVEKIDFKQILELYQNAKMTNNNENEDKKIEKIEYRQKDKITGDEYNRLYNIGSRIIEERKYALVTMAGGQGTRLGHNGPKGTFRIDLISGEKYLFEIVVESLKKANEMFNTIIPWYIMTSRENNEQTELFLKEHNFFGYPNDKIKLFKQGELPLIDVNGKIVLNEDGCIKEASDGNGGVYEAMKKNMIIDDMKQKGIKWVLIGGIDNILLNVADPILIGLTISENNIIGSKSVVKTGPKEKAGVFCRINGKPSVIEYFELSNEMAEQTDENGEYTFGDINIVNHLYNINALENLGEVKLPYHAAIKKSSYLNDNGEMITPDEPNVYKFEAFIFDAFKRFDNMSILRVNRSEEFAPIKNAEGVDSPYTARELYNNKNR